MRVQRHCTLHCAILFLHLGHWKSFLVNTMDYKRESDTSAILPNCATFTFTWLDLTKTDPKNYLQFT